MKILALPTFVLLFVANVSYASTLDLVNQVCPLCNETFTCLMGSSGYQVGVRLDLRPIGAIESPQRVPVCPKCHFVLYADEIPAEELAKCKEIVKDPAYIKQAERESYYLLGLIYEALKNDPLEIGNIFLMASWQVESDEAKLKEDLERSLHHFEIYLKDLPKAQPASEDNGDEPTMYETVQLLKGEILRQLGRFGEARSHFGDLLKLKAYQGKRMSARVKLQISLCDIKDSKPHKMPDVEEEAGTEPTPATAGE